MAGNEYHLIDTKAFDAAIARRSSLESQYTDILVKYDEIIHQLEANWQGDAAKVFFNDAKTIGSNIRGLGDILSTMCNTLEDCRTVIENTDKAAGAQNRNPEK